MATKIIVIEANQESHYNEDGEYDDCVIETQEFNSIRELTRFISTKEYLLLDFISDEFVATLLKTNRFLDKLEEKGFVDVKKAKQVDKEKLLSKLFLMKYSSLFPVRHVDYLLENDIRMMAKEEIQLAREISPSSILDAKQMAVFNNEKERLAKVKKANEEKKKITAEKRKQKEIEKAKKLLAEANAKEIANVVSDKKKEMLEI